MAVPLERGHISCPPTRGKRHAVVNVVWQSSVKLDQGLQVFFPHCQRHMQCWLCRGAFLSVIFPTRVVAILVHAAVCGAMFPWRTLTKLPSLLRVVRRHVVVAWSNP